MSHSLCLGNEHSFGSTFFRSLDRTHTINYTIAWRGASAETRWQTRQTRQTRDTRARRGGHSEDAYTDTHTHTQIHTHTHVHWQHARTLSTRQDEPIGPNGKHSLKTSLNRASVYYARTHTHTLWQKLNGMRD